MSFASLNTQNVICFINTQNVICFINTQNVICLINTQNGYQCALLFDHDVILTLWIIINQSDQTKRA